MCSKQGDLNGISYHLYTDCRRCRRRYKGTGTSFKTDSREKEGSLSEIF